MRERIPTWLKTIAELEKGKICGICQKPIEFKDKYEIDHIYPVSKGGSNSLINIQVVHKACNRKKGANKTMVSPDQWKVWWDLIEPNLDKLRDNQIEAYVNTLERLSNFEKYPSEDYRIKPGGKPKIYCECTGAGKSILMLILGMFLTRKRILIITPTKIIKKNNFDALKDCYNIGLLPEKVYDEIKITTLDQPNSLAYIHSADIVVSTYQKFGKNDGDRVLANLRGDEFDIVLIDEAHHYKEDKSSQNTIHRDIVKKFKNSIVLFFTATPFDAKLNPILEDFDKDKDVIHEYTYADAWKKKYVKYFEWTEIKPEQQVLNITHPSGKIEKINLKQGDFEEARKLSGYKSALSKSMATKISLIHATIQLLDQRNEELRGIAKKNIALMVFPTIKEAEECSKILDQISTRYKHCVVHSKSPDKTLLTDIDNDVYDILLSVSMFKEGFNQKNITIVTLSRNIQSYVFFTQVIGRGVRARNDIYGKPIPVSGHVKNMKDICYIISHEGFELNKYWEMFREMDLENLSDEQEENENTIEKNTGGNINDVVSVSPIIRIEDELVKGYDSFGFDQNRTLRDETTAYYFRKAVGQSDNLQLKNLVDSLWNQDEGIYLSTIFQKARSQEFVDRRNVAPSNSVISKIEDNSKKDFQRETIDKAKMLQTLLKKQLQRSIRRGAPINYGKIMPIMYSTFYEIYGHPLKGGSSKTGYKIKDNDIEFVNNIVPKLIEKYQSHEYFKNTFLPKFKANLKASENIYFID